MIKAALLGLAASVLSATAVFGADLSGIWTGTTSDRNGDLQDLSFRFTQTGDKVAGKMYGDNESTPVEDVTISGDQITFTVTTELNGAISKFLYTGTIKGGEIDLVRKKVGVKPDPAAPDKNQNTNLHLKRLA